MFRLTGKYALVTGSSRGIGRGIALVLAQQGAHVAIHCHSKKAEAESCVEEVRKCGREAFALQADVAKKADVDAMFAEIQHRWKRLDILVNNAGMLDFASFLDLTEEQWDRLLAVNLKGQFLCAQGAATMMKVQGWGRIINITSIASGGIGIGFPQIAHYTASKGGIIGMTETMALELGPAINVNAVAPGAIETDMTTATLQDEKTKQGILARVAKKRIGTPADIGAAVAFLASEEADYITGTTLYVDGGWLAS